MILTSSSHKRVSREKWLQNSVPNHAPPNAKNRANSYIHDIGVENAHQTITYTVSPRREAARLIFKRG